MRGGILDVVLVRESTDAREAHVTVTDGIVPPDAYHPPLDIDIAIKVSRQSDRIEPSNIDSSRDWNFGKANRQTLYEMLSEVSWRELFELEDCDVCLTYFYDIIYNLFNSCVLLCVFFTPMT
ncbi:unnamed protein product [Euphydryas editha]|uniref:Uncharacterized protein n=1 Tax=Euphydryas editha TaxID=104508 RepID=A0AAU9V441_EUPED|nr:unnamed protein product [Euphydryas editha]